MSVGILTQGGAAAPLTLGFGIKPLRGNSLKVLPENLRNKKHFDP
jgi:hypothetical protein